MRLGQKPLLAIGLLALTAATCASAGKTKHSDEGARTLTAVVTQREYDAGSSGAGGYRSSGNWYLSFEAEDGDKTVHYRFPVTQQQYFRNPEGTRVRLILDGDRLRDIQPARE
jgi:hypothetical protein